MRDDAQTTERPLAGLSENAWIRKLAQVTQIEGHFSRLGDAHFAAYVAGRDATETLVVTFETMQGIRALSETAEPIGWDLCKALGWGHLCIASNGDTWFRDEEIYQYFDDLIDDGFFDDYETVVFYGAGPCGYAAAAYSVVSPGATVVAIQPQATLDPRVTGWDERFVEQRRMDFTSRFGYAPDMIDAAKQAFVIFDPAEIWDAMHASLFTRPNVTMLPLRHMGDAIQSDLMQMQVLYRLLAQAGAGRLTDKRFAQLYRNRREHAPYLRRVMAALDAKGREKLVWMLSKNVTSRMHAPRFARRLAKLNATLGKEIVDG